MQFALFALGVKVFVGTHERGVAAKTARIINNSLAMDALGTDGLPIPC